MSRGHVEELPSGRFRSRRGKETVGIYDTRELADLALDGGNLAAYWHGFLIRRRASGVRDVKNEESRWDLYVGADPLALVPLGELSRKDGKAWLHRMQGRGLAAQTVKNALNLLRIVCADAVDAEVLKENPFATVKLHRSTSARTHEGWTILDPDEQLALLRVVATEETHMVAFALHTGLRNSELWSLRTSDIDIDAREVTVRFSKGDRPVKSGTIRRVPLFGLGLEAARFTVERGHEFAWPSPRTNARRYDSSHPSRWTAWLKAARIKRHVRWYDLRHTTATSLLAGWWGRKWSLDEVRQMLGHSSVKVTERYAHLIDDTIRRAARETPGLSKTEPTTWGDDGATLGIRTPDLRFTNASGLEGFSGVALREHHERFEGPGNRAASAILAGLRVALQADQRTGPSMARAKLLEAARALGVA